MRNAGTPREGWRVERRRGLFPRSWFVRILLVLGVAVSVAVWLEMRESWVQARFFSEWAQGSGYSVEPGGNPDIWLPAVGPYDERLGYARLREALPRLAAAGFEVTAQARQTHGFREITGRGLYPIYREKSQAGLSVLDRRGESLYATLFPQRQYGGFETIPPVVVESLLYIENRELLDADHPRRNPAVEWDRFGRAVIGQAVRAVDPDGASRAGGSTLATQIEKFRHSPGGRTQGAREKLRQMASASLRAYQAGEETFTARRRIVLDFVNSVPLGAVPGVGEVNGLGDGLWAWYGRDFNEANRLLLAASTDPVAAAAPFKESLSLFIAQRRPSELLGENAARLGELADSHLRLLARDGIISERLRDAALAVVLKPRDTPLPPPPVSFVERKAVNAARAVLADFLDVDNLYALDRYDLSARTTLDAAAQNAVTRFLAGLKEDATLKCLGLKGDRLLTRGDPAEVRFSFTLFEATPQGNLLRVQADNVDQPLDINVGTKLDLGSSAKFRTMVSYLEVVADLHRRYGGLDAEGLRGVRTGGGDNLTRWALDHLTRAEDKGLPTMLDAALERRYLASPQETFFTGGGLHTFQNFKREDDAKVPSVYEALEQSVNLPFVRIMRDVVHYHAFEAEDAPGSDLRTGEEAARRRFLSRFADQEGRAFLAHFYRKYRGTPPEDLLPALISDLRPLPSRLAAAFLGVEPQADFAAFAAFMAGQLGERAGSEVQLRKLYATYAPLRLNLSDQGYLARVHPLELWLVGYLKQNPGAGFDQVVAASVKERQEAYRWLLNSRFRHAQDVRIRIALEAVAFERIAAAWKKVGYPFERLVPSFATAIGSSADRPAALAELMGVVINDGIRQATVRVDELRFAAGTPFETQLAWTPRPGVRVLPAEVAAAARKALLRVVNNGTARRVKDTYRDADEKPLPVGGKTGTGDHRFDVIGAGGQVKFSRVVNRAATFVFYVGDRFFGTVTAFVPGEQAAAYDFTSALPVQIFKEMEPLLRPLVSGRPGAMRPRCAGQGG